MSARRDLGQAGLSPGKKARLHRILYRHGLGNGTARIYMVPFWT
jgi:fructose-bisphosphate aldolase, class I